MIKASWLTLICQKLNQQKRRTAEVRQTRAEALEQRNFLSVSTLLVNQELRIVADSNESIAVQIDPANPGRVQVLIDGSPTNGLAPIQANQLRAIEIQAGQGHNLINLNAVNSTAFSFINPVTREGLQIRVDAGNGNDTLFGSQSFEDTLIGGDGDDIINLAPVATISLGQVLDGGDGNDVILGGVGDDTILGRDGDDLLNGGVGNDTIFGGDGNDFLNGDAGADSINGNQGEDVIDGGLGNDILGGDTGTDTVSGGGDDDLIQGGGGDDRLDGDAGNDSLIGQSGNDVLDGGDGQDSLYGSAGLDSLSGGNGDDLLLGELGNDTVNGDAGNDSMIGGGGRDLIDGGSGDDTGKGNSGNDTLTGGAGSDALSGGNGHDLMTSGTSAATMTLMEILNTSVVEGDAGTLNAVFTVNLSAAASVPITVDYATLGGTAIEGLDYLRSSGSLTFLPGVTSGNIVVAINGDLIDEVNEFYAVLLSNPTNVTIVDDEAQGTIVDNDGLPPVVSPSVALANATQYLRQYATSFGLVPGDLQSFVVTDQYTTEHNGVTQLYLQQTYQGLRIIDSTINVNVLADGSILSANSSFMTNVARFNLSAVPRITAAQAFNALGAELAEHLLADQHSHNSLAEDSVPGTGSDAGGGAVTPLSLKRTEIPDRLQWAKTDNGGLQLVWTVNVQTLDEQNWFDASISTATGELAHNSSWISHATYNVFEYTLEGPLDGVRSLEIDPQNPLASPFGWHDTNGATGAEFTVTNGNNVSAQEDRNNDNLAGFQPDGGVPLLFDFPFNDVTLQPLAYEAAAITNLFYTNNILHDIHYQYGFNELSGNFQVNNYGNGGAGGDAVQADAQDGSGFNNANFGTPPDGFAPRMQQFIFTLTNPNRDSDVENSIIIHEYGHGVSNRLTGGPANANALNALQSGGMGEGWSDWWALMFSQKVIDQANDPRPMGNYVLGQTASGGGIRRFPYSFDLNIDPLTFADFNGGFPNNEVHNAGEIWASALWDMNWLLINGFTTPDCDGNTSPGLGFDPDLYNGTGGNNVAMQLVMDGLKLQPANPTFTQARDAILQADIVNFGGANQRAITTAFARRGLGFSANAGFDADSTFIFPAFDTGPELGVIRFDQLTYQAGDLVGMQICDGDLTAPSVTVNVTTSEGDSEPVIFVRQADLSYLATISLVPGGTAVGNGVLDLSTDSLLLSATYQDSNNGLGQSATIVTFASVNASTGDTLLGGAGDDTLTGADGDDFLAGGAGADIMDGQFGNDVLLGGTDNDTISGGAGDDVLQGQSGNDSLDGGAGNDQLIWRGGIDGDDFFDAGDGQDAISLRGTGGIDNYAIGQAGSNLTLMSGGATLTIGGPTEMVGSPVEAITLDLLAGNDTVVIGSVDNIGLTILTVNGGLGNDVINGTNALTGSVRLIVNGDAGDDVVSGTDGDDEINGGEGNDLISGRSGNDLIHGDAGDDVIRGVSGRDSLFGDSGNDNLDGGTHDDSLDGGSGSDVIAAGIGNDTAFGDTGDDLLIGADGHDLLEGGAGADALIGGDGDDTLDGGHENDTLNGNAGNDKLRGDDGDDFLMGQAGNDTIDGGDGNDTIDAGDGNDGLLAGDGDDNVQGGLGDDTIVGGDGDDLLLGGIGRDILLGEDGDDTINGNGGSDVIAVGEGRNSIISPVTGERFEDFVLSIVILATLDASN